MERLLAYALLTALYIFGLSLVHGHDKSVTLALLITAAYIAANFSVGVWFVMHGR